MGINRRNFLKVAGAAGGILLAGGARSARSAQTPQTPEGSVEFYGLLIDTTKCIGCRACEEACNAQNSLPKPEVSFSSESVFEKKRETTPGAYVVVNRFPNGKDPEKPIFVRKQCMHCTEPSCASACLCKAMEKMPEGPTVYHKDRCMGCRYCMISCPFDIPKFEYDKASPFVKKCIGCPDRVAKGEQTACAEACPEGATLFGKRRDLIEEAKKTDLPEPGPVLPAHLRGTRGRGNGVHVPLGRPVRKDRLPDRPGDEALPGADVRVPVLRSSRGHPLAGGPVRLQLPHFRQRGRGREGERP